jgi:hypothetical protein
MLTSFEMTREAISNIIRSLAVMELQGSKFISIQQLVYTQFSYLFSKHVVYIYVIIYIFYL